MKIKKIGILKEENIKDGTMLETISQSGVQCYCSDLARITEVPYNLENGFGEYWIDGKHVITKKNKTTTNNMNYINNNGAPCSTYRNEFKSGVRICFSFDDIEDLHINELENLRLEYPLTIIGGRVRETIDKLFVNKSKLVITTGRNHFVDGKEYREYEAFGIRFIRKKCKVHSKVLSDGTVTKADTDIYLKVEDIPLIVDEKSQLVYSLIILFGASFDKEGREFQNSDLNKYLNSDFLKSIND